MIRSSLLVPAFAIAALLVAAPVAASPTADPEPHSASVEFYLPANNGLHAHLGTFNDQVSLQIKRKGRSVTYQVWGESTEAGLRAKFGKLGQVDVAFTPTKTLRTVKPPKGCEGEPSTFREGIFAGTIEFTGEREYVRIEATQAKGAMDVNRKGEWRCPRQKGPVRIHRASRPSTLSPRERSEAKRESALLYASSNRCGCLFGALAVRDRRGRGPSTFFGEKWEEREGMNISRVTFANAGASAFVFDHAAGTARLHPPQPFSGNGAFKRRSQGRDLWRSTIRVPLLGADPFSFRGRSFRVELTREVPGE